MNLSAQEIEQIVVRVMEQLQTRDATVRADVSPLSPWERVGVRGVAPPSIFKIRFV